MSGACLLCLASTLLPAGAQELAPVTIQGTYDNAIRTSDAASQGVVTAKLIENRPTLRPAEVLEFVPGVIVTQHSGDGKANQYFLRGFNLDHGTDFATYVDGMPVNMPTHAHGHGYSDLNWLIPELVNRISYKKGPYFADEGDFSSAGVARLGLFDSLPEGIASLTLGDNSYARALLTQSVPWQSGKLLYALETAHNNGPWDDPERFHRVNGVLRYSTATDSSRTSVTAMAYSAAWHSTDQIPQRAVDQGLVGRFGALDPTDGGHTERTSLSFQTERKSDTGLFKANAYAIASKLSLVSNFTYNLGPPRLSLRELRCPPRGCNSPWGGPAANMDDPEPLNADQFIQAESRRVLGGAASQSFATPFGGYDSTTTIGTSLRMDWLDPVGLYQGLAGQRVATVQESQVQQSLLGLYAENSTAWTPTFRTLLGARYDRMAVDVRSSIAGNAGQQTADLASPKLSFILGPWNKTEYFVNLGSGFHSNDARGVIARIAPKEGTPIDPAPALVRTTGGELGLRTEAITGLQSSLALWQLNIGSELVFSGDAGDTGASGASRRFGLEFNNHYRATPWLLLDADLAVSRAEFDAPQGDAPNAGRYVPGSVETVVSVGAVISDRGPWSGQFQLRYFGPRPLIEDNSQRSEATTLAYLRLGYQVSRKTKLALDVFNLFDSKASDIDYYYASRLKGEPPEGVADRHFHPVEPRSLRLTLTTHF
ncbi:MAG: TonB-dependent receptor [Comamonadaceae bacterium PBBC2]|nr:MAG: TonB-dependent receptor [Comamonadaceae bacterium PBBC2]